ncbi:MAG TPA: iron-containing alcohol dehydrogenase [Archaeoglobus profundus]|nr:iron-containing alcohol dehydrogenase [Archaeoglobus profundus]
MKFKSIEIPFIVEISEHSRKRLRGILENLNLRYVVMITGENSYRVAGMKIEEKIKELITDKFFVKEASMNEVKRIVVSISYGDVDCVVGVGGGKVLDVAKVVASELNVPFVSIPTAASHDGIASPVASFKENGKPVSILVNPPTVVLADLTILRHSPIRLLRSGYGDLISNIVAVKDWKLARDKIGEEYNEVAASMALMPANLMLTNPGNLKEKIELLVRGLILSGVAIALVRSSRPASGAEHKFSHALDYLGYGHGTHGEQVGLGTIIMEYLHEKYYGTGDWEMVKEALEKVQAPTTAKELGLNRKQVLEALMYAKNIRKRRYTILEDVNPSKDEFEIVLDKTGIA